MKTKIICLSNQKGGVAKTTSTLNIASALALKGKKVLVVDLDAQCSLVLSMGYNPLDFNTSIADAFEKDLLITTAIYETEIENLSLIPSTPLLATLDLKLINQMSREKKLSKALKHLDGIYDFILLDSPPQLSLITINAFTASDYIIIPCETSQLSYYALDSLLDTIEGVKEELNEKLEIMGVIATLYDNRTLIDRMVLTSLQQKYEVLGVIKRTVAAKRGLDEGIPVVIKEPKSEIACEYKKIADLIISKVGD